MCFGVVGTLRPLASYASRFAVFSFAGERYLPLPRPGHSSQRGAEDIGRANLAICDPLLNPSGRKTRIFRLVLTLTISAIAIRLTKRGPARGSHPAGLLLQDVAA